MANRENRLDPAVLKLAGVLIVGALAPLLDSTVVNVALHTLAHQLHTSLSTVQWVSTGYLLALVMAVPITGWAVDRVGGKRMWLAGLGLFLAGSVLSASAWNIGALIVFRVVQGVGGGFLMPIVQTLVMRAAGGRGLGKLMAVITLPALIGPILGPVLGGVIVGGLSWQWIFYLNVPLCLIAMLLAWRHIPADPPPDGAGRLDLPGLALLSPALAALVYALAQVGNQGGVAHLQVLLPLAGGGLLLAGFLGHALRAANPLIDLRLFHVRSFTASAALLFSSGLALFGSMFLVPIYYQQLRGATVIAAGLLLAPQGLGSLLARVTGPLTDRVGPRPVILGGLVCTTLGTLPFALAGAHTGIVLLSVALAIRGLGLSAVNLGVFVGAYRDLAPSQVPHASSITRLVQQLGGAVGTAVLAVVLQRQLAGHLGAAGHTIAFDHTFFWAVAFTALAIIPALLLPRLQRSEPEQTTDNAAVQDPQPVPAAGGG
jgi:EmrB/QacA subfamily drug resistance transporter